MATSTALLGRPQVATVGDVELVAKHEYTRLMGGTNPEKTATATMRTWRESGAMRSTC